VIFWRESPFSIAPRAKGDFILKVMMVSTVYNGVSSNSPFGVELGRSQRKRQCRCLYGYSATYFVLSRSTVGVSGTRIPLRKRCEDKYQSSPCPSGFWSHSEFRITWKCDHPSPTMTEASGIGVDPEGVNEIRRRGQPRPWPRVGGLASWLAMTCWLAAVRTSAKFGGGANALAPAATTGQP
jgi:hypothetical protein